MKNQKTALRTLIAKLWYQFPVGETTFAECEVDGCEQPARGGAICPVCLVQQIALITGEEAAQKFVDSLSRTIELESNLYQKVKTVEKKGA